MPSYRLSLPKITWGASFANTLQFGYPLDGVQAGPEPRTGSDYAEAPSGVEDAWIVGTNYVLAAQARYIPTADTTDPSATGWDGATGFGAFLTWAQNKNQFRFYPDSTGGTFLTCYLVAPLSGQPTQEADGTRNVQFSIRNAAAAFDGY